MNQMIAPPGGVKYLHGQYPTTAIGQARSVAPLQQLAAAAAASNGGGRNRLLGANSSLAGANPFGLSTANTNNAFAGLYGTAGYPAAAAAAAGGLLGLQSRGLGTVPLIQELPNRQRRVQPRGGHLEVAGMIVGSWGANYGPNGNLTNSLAAAAAAAGGRNMRVPMTPGGYPNQNIQVNDECANFSLMSEDYKVIPSSFSPQVSLFDQMRISGANKVPNRAAGQGGGQWQKKTPGKNQVRFVLKDLRNLNV